MGTGDSFTSFSCDGSWDIPESTACEARNHESIQASMLAN